MKKVLIVTALIMVIGFTLLFSGCSFIYDNGNTERNPYTISDTEKGKLDNNFRNSWIG